MKPPVPLKLPREARAGGGGWGKARQNGGFAETRWSLVSRVGEGGEIGEAALEELCRLAWVPLFFYARRLGWSAEDAEDAVQTFLATACRKGIFAAARENQGRLRTFLLTAFKRTLLNEQRHRNAGRRGGGQAVLSLQLEGIEEHYLREYCETETPDRLFHRQWALGIMQAALTALETEYAETGRAVLFEALAAGLEGEMPPGGYTAAAAALGMTENAVRQAMHRLRLAFRRELWRAVAVSLGSLSEEEISLDLRALHEALAPG